MNTLRRKAKIVALNTIDGILESSIINNIYEILSIYIPQVFFLSSITDRILKKLSKIVVPEGLSVAIIMDGNRRYAKRAGITRKNGHIKGYNHVTRIVEYLNQIKCKNVGFFAFGKKNYSRTKEEVSDIMSILDRGLTELEKSEENTLKGRIEIVGDADSMPPKIAEHTRRINGDKTKKKDCFMFISYSSLDQYVNTKTDGVTVPFDIIIRPGGEKRLSDFLLCNAAAHSTISFVETKWPILTPFHIFLSIVKYRIEKSL